MKKVLFVLLALAVSMTAKANLSCVVPQQDGSAPVMTATVEVSEESQGDFVTLTINESATSQLVYFNQMDKGAFNKGIQDGSLATLVLSETAKMVNGAVKGAGFIVLQKDDKGALSGFASLNDTFYPLQCK
jgi:hypothetical protein